MFQPPPFGKNGDVEAGNRQLYPGQMEDPRLRWAFIRKIYSILMIQMLLTIAIGCLVIFVEPVKNFFASRPAGLITFIVLMIVPFIVLIPLYCCREKHPLNLILLGLFTIAMSFMVGVCCSFTKGKIVLLAVILTAAVVISLTLYTFWAAKRGKDFSFLGPILFCALIILFLYGLIQIIFPLGKISQTIYGALGALIFSGYIIFDTDNIIKRYTYDQYVWAALSLYLDIINLFMSLLNLLRGIS